MFNLLLKREEMKFPRQNLNILNLESSSGEHLFSENCNIFLNYEIQVNHNRGNIFIPFTRIFNYEMNHRFFFT